MTVFPVRRALPLNPRTRQPAVRDVPVDTAVPVVRTGPMEWARRRRAEREARRVEAAGARALTRLDRLGPAWHILDWPRTDPTRHWSEVDSDDRAGFLAIGPGGVFAVTVADHGRARVLLAGDVVQISGKRPPYVAEARRDAKRAGRTLSAAVGLTVPVTPVLAFVGSGVISVHGLPKDCLVATHRELDRLLVAGGARISTMTAAKLAAVAAQPATWLNGWSRRAGDQRFRDQARSATDNRSARR